MIGVLISNDPVIFNSNKKLNEPRRCRQSVAPIASFPRLLPVRMMFFSGHPRRLLELHFFPSGSRQSPEPGGAAREGLIVFTK
jgi:hypothetical protein